MDKKASITLYITFLIFAIIIIVITAVVAPFGVKLNAEAYKMGEQIYLSTNESIQDIQNQEIKLSIQSQINDSLDTINQNLEVNNALFKWSWLIMIMLTSFVVFLITRSIVEVNSRLGGGLV